MLDIKFIRENKDAVIAGAQKKHIDLDIEKLIALDDARRALQASFDTKRAEQNAASDAIAQASAEERDALIATMQALKESLKKDEEALADVLKEWQGLMVRVPNVPDFSVPEGKSDAENVEVRRWAPEGGDGADPAAIAFETKSHVDLMLMHDMADFERGAKVAGFRGYFLKNDGARLEWALRRFVEDRFMNREGFTPIVVPSMLRRESFVGTGYLPQSEEDLYKTQDADYLAGTAEVEKMG